MEKGIFVPPSSPYGYRLVGRELEIIPEEAEITAALLRLYHKLKEDGGKITRDTKSHGRPRWVCPDCGAIVHISDKTVQRQVSQRLRKLPPAKTDEPQ